jgi:hypothetical protein
MDLSVAILPENHTEHVILALAAGWQKISLNKFNIVRALGDCKY